MACEVHRMSDSYREFKRKYTMWTSDLPERLGLPGHYLPPPPPQTNVDSFFRRHGHAESQKCGICGTDTHETYKMVVMTIDGSLPTINICPVCMEKVKAEWRSIPRSRGK